eukprot:13993615-Heterocapsa_arctica.AAC.1
MGSVGRPRPAATPPPSWTSRNQIDARDRHPHADAGGERALLPAFAGGSRLRPHVVGAEPPSAILARGLDPLHQRRHRHADRAQPE